MLIKELSELSGVSGNEGKVRSYIKEQLSQMSIKYQVDSIGNLFAFKEGKNRSGKYNLMLSAHMDEVGMMISSVEKSGHLRFYKIGGVDEASLLSTPVTIGNDNVPGVIGAKAIHLQKKEERNNPLDIEKMYIDIGAKNKEDAEKAVKAGDYICFHTRGKLQEKNFKGKALDNRAGCAALLELLRRDCLYPFTAVFTVQEEVGLRGAKVAAYRVDPDVALVLETTTAADMPEIKKHEHATTLGAGPAFSLKDDSMLGHPKVLKALTAAAEEADVNYQFRRYTGSFTDAGVISLSRSGVMTGVVSTPCRYIHTPVSLLDINDWKNLVDTVYTFINSVQEKGLEG